MTNTQANVIFLSMGSQQTNKAQHTHKQHNYLALFTQHNSRYNNLEVTTMCTDTQHKDLVCAYCGDIYQQEGRIDEGLCVSCQKEEDSTINKLLLTPSDEDTKQLVQIGTNTYEISISKDPQVVSIFIFQDEEYPIKRDTQQLMDDLLKAITQVMTNAVSES